jgi:HK97 gp10 family phage protein
MPGFAGLKFGGGKELDAALKKLPARLSRTLKRDALVFAAEKHLVPAIRATAPRGPGNTHIGDHIIIRRALGTAGARLGADAVGIAIGPERRAYFYGGFLEFGTEKMPAQPFMRPSFDRTVEAMIQTVGRDLWVSLAGKGINRESVSSQGPVSGGPGGSTI